jgi:class 3 adenylate cyclase/tetratricopeptide (TPR) repeat protein
MRFSCRTRLFRNDDAKRQNFGGAPKEICFLSRSITLGWWAHSSNLMIEIKKSATINRNPALSGLVDRYDSLISELAPKHATAVWSVSEPSSTETVVLQVSDAYGRSSRELSSAELFDSDRIYAKVSRLVGDLIYQQCENLHDVTTLAHLASFTPGRLCHRFAQSDPEIPLPSNDSAAAAVLFADISGFTSLTERLAQKGPAGAEELTTALNNYFGELIEIVSSYGGDILKFAGDALLATFESSESDSALQDATNRAAKASTTIQRELRNFPAIEGTQLSLKIGLAAGDLRHLHLGGVFGRCELLIVGQPLVDLVGANDLAGAGEIIATESFWECLDPKPKAKELPNRHFRFDTSTVSNHATTIVINGQDTLANTPFRPIAVAAMRGYIPAAIYSRIAAGQTDWLGELRKVTVVFVNLPDFDQDIQLGVAQELMIVLQRTVYEFEGSLNKLSVDDKGVSMLVGFGVPPVAHEDDPARAVGAALALAERISGLGRRCSIGIATGRVYCGAYGSDFRREYTMIGDTVNTSARLMQAASNIEHDADVVPPILCDQSTWHGADSRYEFSELEPIQLKGKKDAVACFRPIARRTQTLADSALRMAVIGRKTECGLFDQMLKGLVDDKEGSIMFLEGEAGVGKSHLVKSFQRIARKAHCRILEGRADAIERSTPWYMWRPIVENLLGVENRRLEPEWLGRAIRDRFDLDKETLKLLPLLSSVLPVHWPENEWVAQMTGPIRAAHTNNLISLLIQRAATNDSLIILIEDANWMDSSSLTLLRQVATEVEPAVILVSSRPLTRPVSRDCAAILRLPATNHIELGVLPVDNAVHLARHLIDADELPEQVEDLIRDRTQGHPLFVEELAHALCESKTLEVVNRIARLTGDLAEFADRERFKSLDDVIVNRIDRLSPTAQLTLKVASVIGYEFQYPMLRDIFPLIKERAGLLDNLEHLDRGQLMEQMESQTEIEYTFRHRTIRDVAYDGVLKKHRVELHRAIAEWIKENKAEEIEAHYSLLAEHWLQAGHVHEAIECLTIAGRNALKINANQEAARFYRKAISLESMLDERIDPIERANWHRRYGEALYRHGEMSLSLKHFRIALKMFGHADPESMLGKMAGACIEFVRQDWHRLRTRIFGAKTTSPKEETLESIRAYERLFEIHYMRNDQLSIFVATFRSLNLSQKQGFWPGIARASSCAAITVGAMQLHKTAQKYAEQAIHFAEESGDARSLGYSRSLNAVLFLTIGDWQRATESVSLGLKISKEIGDRRCFVEALGISLSPLVWQGDWDRVIESCNQLYLQSEKDNVPQAARWAMSWLLWCESARRPLDTAVTQYMQTTAGLMEADHEEPDADRLIIRSSLMVSHMRRGDWERAVDLANDVEAVLGKAQHVVFYLSQTYYALSDFYFALSLHGVDTPWISQKELRKRMRKLHNRIRIFSVVVPICAPLRHLHAGRRKVLKGRLRSARHKFEKGIKSAESYGMPYVIGSLEFELSDITESESEQRTLRTEATERFRGLGIDQPSVVFPRVPVADGLR